MPFAERGIGRLDRTKRPIVLNSASQTQHTVCLLSYTESKNFKKFREIKVVTKSLSVDALSCAALPDISLDTPEHRIFTLMKPSISGVS